ARRKQAAVRGRARGARVLHGPVKDQDEFSTGHHKEIFSAGCNAGRRLCAACRPRAWIKLGMDRHDRRRKGDAGDWPRSCPVMHSVSWVSIQDAAAKAKEE